MKRTGRSIGQVKKKARSVASRIRRPPLARRLEEVKFLDTVEPATTCATTGTISIGSLNIVPQNDTESGRTGRKITITRLQCRGQIVIPPTTVAADSYDKVRLMFVLDTQTNGSNPTVATLLQSAAINSYLNMANSSRFKVLSDEIYDISCTAGGAPTGSPSFGGAVKSWSFYKKVNIPIEFDSSASDGSIGTQRTNNIFCLGISLNGKATSAFTCRIRYLDN